MATVWAKKSRQSHIARFQRILRQMLLSLCPIQLAHVRFVSGVAAALADNAAIRALVLVLASAFAPIRSIFGILDLVVVLLEHLVVNHCLFNVLVDTFGRGVRNRNPRDIILAVAALHRVHDVTRSSRLHVMDNVGLVLLVNLEMRQRIKRQEPLGAFDLRVGLDQVVVREFILQDEAFSSFSLEAVHGVESFKL